MRAGSRHEPSRRERTVNRTAERAPGARSGSADVERLTRALEPVIKSAGLDLESVRVLRAGRRCLLRIVVDGDARPGLDTIAVVSRSVSAELDASGVMGEAAYTLEVSSPGVDRPLTQPRHWRRAEGRLVRVPLAAPGSAAASASAKPLTSQTELPGRRGAVEGRVIAADQDRVTLEIDGTAREFRYQQLGPGRVQVEFSAAGDPDPGNNRDTAKWEAIPGGPGDEGEPDGH